MTAIDCAGCENTIDEPTDDHEVDGDYYCHNCHYEEMFGRGPLAEKGQA